VDYPLLELDELDMQLHKPPFVFFSLQLASVIGVVHCSELQVEGDPRLDR
jgi:hypothetical protein